MAALTDVAHMSYPLKGENGEMSGGGVASVVIANVLKGALLGLSIAEYIWSDQRRSSRLDQNGLAVGSLGVHFAGGIS